MTIKSGISIDAQLVPTSSSAIVTPPPGTRYLITAATFFTNTGSPTLSLFLVSSGGSPGVGNQTTSKAMVADETYIATELIGQTIENGGTLQANDGTGTGVEISAVITVTEFSGTS